VEAEWDRVSVEVKAVIADPRDAPLLEGMLEGTMGDTGSLAVR